MPRFIAVHTLTMPEAQLLETLKNHPPLPAGTSWNLTYCDFTDGKFFCEWEAPSKDAIAEYFKTTSMPFDAIYPVRLLDVVKGTLEPEQKHKTATG